MNAKHKDTHASEHEHERDPHGAPGLPEEIGELHALLASLEAERDDLRAKYQRALADCQNMQRRGQEDIDAARQRGVESAISSVITALDTLDQALAFDPEKVPAAQVVQGVRMIQQELLRAAQRHGVVVIEPAPNDEFDPQRHEALTRQAGEGVEPGRIVHVYQPGYAIGARVIRPAKVVVAPPADEEA